MTHQTGHLANHTRLATQRLHLSCLDSVRIKTPTSGNGEMRAAIMRCAAADRGAGMVQFTIIPRGRGYWIEIVGNDGSRQAVERYDTEERPFGGFVCSRNERNPSSGRIRLCVRRQRPGTERHRSTRTVSALTCRYVRQRQAHQQDQGDGAESAAVASRRGDCHVPPADAAWLATEQTNRP